MKVGNWLRCFIHWQKLSSYLMVLCHYFSNYCEDFGISAWIYKITDLRSTFCSSIKGVSMDLINKSTHLKKRFITLGELVGKIESLWREASVKENRLDQFFKVTQNILCEKKEKSAEEEFNQITLVLYHQELSIPWIINLNSKWKSYGDKMYPVCIRLITNHLWAIIFYLLNKN